MKRLHLIVATAVGFLTIAALPVPAQDWPSKPVHILVGFGAGGGTDVATRILADGLSEALGQQFTVENRPGAGGTIAGGIAAKAPKDGYTIISLSMGHSVSLVLATDKALAKSSTVLLSPLVNTKYNKRSLYETCRAVAEAEKPKVALGKLFD